VVKSFPYAETGFHQDEKMLYEMNIFPYFEYNIKGISPYSIDFSLNV
jgi:hypothetical protein